MRIIQTWMLSAYVIIQFVDTFVNSECSDLACTFHPTVYGLRLVGHLASCLEWEQLFVARKMNLKKAPNNDSKTYHKLCSLYVDTNVHFIPFLKLHNNFLNASSSQDHECTLRWTSYVLVSLSCADLPLSARKTLFFAEKKTHFPLWFKYNDDVPER